MYLNHINVFKKYLLSYYRYLAQYVGWDIQSYPRLYKGGQNIKRNSARNSKSILTSLYSNNTNISICFCVRLFLLIWAYYKFVYFNANGLKTFILF